MTTQELERRQRRAETERFVIAEAEDGFRIHAPSAGGRPYRVTGIPDAPACTCPDFEQHARDPEWRCKHILAVRLRRNGSQSPSSDDRYETEERQAIQEESRQPETNGRARMLLKRSVSPDGRIDSLSVELACPVEDGGNGEVEERAERLLGLQEGIVRRFLSRNGGDTQSLPPHRGNGATGRPHTSPKSPRSPTSPEPAPSPESNQSVPAQLLRIGGSDGKWGRRLFMTVQAEGRALRLYGSSGQLAEHLERAGYIAHAGNVREGVKLNLPCRIKTETRDGGFVVVTEVLPPRPH